MSLSRVYMLAAMEWMKLSTRLNIVFTIVVFALTALQVGFAVRVELAGSVTDFSAGAVHAELIYSNAYRYIDNIAFTFIPILFLLNVSKEFEYAVVHRSLVSGISRSEYYFSKLLQLIFFSLCAVMLAILFTILASLFYDLPLKFDYFKISMYFPVSFGLSSLGLLLVMMVRKSIYALTVFIVYVLSENILIAMLSEIGIYILLPFQACMQLLRHSMYEYEQVSMLAIYTLLFLLIGLRRFLKMDLP